MATHSSVLAWRIPGMGSHRVGHDWNDLAVAAYYLISVTCLQETTVVQDAASHSGNMVNLGRCQWVWKCGNAGRQGHHLKAKASGELQFKPWHCNPYLEAQSLGKNCQWEGSPIELYWLIRSIWQVQASQVAQWVTNPPAMQETQETQVQSPGWEDPLGRAWQPTPVFVPEQLHGQKNLVGYSPWGRKESACMQACTSCAPRWVKESHWRVVPGSDLCTA